ncbi:hypothetical protein SAMN02745157_1636 [Kaistia soli DSM 19436]|uniref:Uncharacterized protein n=1 Tax=Kaistia soli DSM 19436 TaxID=1122133 RepID=A0A1M4YX22_9HYPH|nr:hypothetical protein [Kaistia soli]SHF09886.1 hypothetical protein SAMN02745157_1636 [Kaistia soli DSM 19436]
MANGRQATTKRMKMAERAEQAMNVHFPNMPSWWLWHRKTNDGFATIPRTLPIVMQAADAQSKGQPAGHVLFSLWIRAPDHPVLTIEHPATFAAEAGFVGERAIDTWRKRMKRLRELNLIMTKPGASGEFHYVLLLNPNASLEWMRSAGLVQDGLYGRFVDRLIEVGAYGELEAVHEGWAAAAKAAAQAPSIEQAIPAQTIPAAEVPPV